MNSLGMTEDLWWLTLSLGFKGLGFGLFMIFWPLYIEQLGGTPLDIGVLASVGGVAAALVLVPGGWLTDRIDRRKILWAGALFAVPAPFLFAWAPAWRWLIPGVLLLHSSNLSRPTAQALVQAKAPPARLSTAYSIVMSAFEAGMVIGSPLGTYLATRLHSYSTVFLFAGLSLIWSLACLIPVRASLPARTQGAPQWTPRGRPRYQVWILLGGAMAFVDGLSMPFVVPFWKSVGHLHLETIGWLGAIGILTGTLSGPIWGKLADRFGFSKALSMGLFMVAAGWAALIWRPSSALWGMWSAIGRGVGEGCHTVVGAAVGRLVSNEAAGTAYGLYNLVSEVARSVAPVPGGALYGHFTNLPFALAAFFDAIMAWIAWQSRPRGPATALAQLRRLKPKVSVPKWRS